MAAPIEVAIALDGSYHLGHEIGEVINEHVIQPVVDHHEAGSGPVGEWYLEHVANHFDPIHPVESAEALWHEATHDHPNDSHASDHGNSFDANDHDWF